MARGRLEPILQFLRQTTHPPCLQEPTDRQLLERYVAHRDAAAFTTIVRRHGGLVRSVCQRVLGHDQDSEDAFQATFLVLVCRAASIRKTAALPSWLHGVAFRTARSARRARKEQSGLDADPQANSADQPVTAAALREIQVVLDEEVGLLPERYRAPFVLCCLAGKSRAEAARELGWKEGTLSSRLAHARAALQRRLTRRGIALAAALTALELSRNASRAAPEILNRTARAALAFAAGRTAASEAVSAGASALVKEILRTTTLPRMKLVAWFVLTASILTLGVGLTLPRVFAIPTEASPVQREAPPDGPNPRPEAAAAPTLRNDPEKPLRVLLFASGPSRDYQLVRSLFVKQVEKKQMELTICLQSHTRGGMVQDVPPERMLTSFPPRLVANENKDDRFANLAEYDVIIAFDPDWSLLTEEQANLLEQWVGKEGRGLILVAGPLHTFELVRPPARKYKAILDLVPVRLLDIRVEGKEHDLKRPWPLAFPATEPFLKLDARGKDPLAGWSEFFFDKPRDDWQKTEDRPERGFYNPYPVKGVRPGATILATFREAEARIPVDGKFPDLPYLVSMPYGKGKTVFLGSAETWRLRQFKESYFDQFWTQLSRSVASVGAAAAPAPTPRAAAITPLQCKTADKGLAWLVSNQQRDGHWDGPEGSNPVTMTALAATALMLQGSTIKEGAYAEPMQKAMHWLSGRAQPDGGLGTPQDPADLARHMEGHARALIFLASVHGEEQDSVWRHVLQDRLTRAVRFLVKAQTSGGGWGAYVRGRDKTGDDGADVASTVLQLQALRAARGAGIEVPKEAVDKGWKYLEKTVDSSKPETITALSGAVREFDNPAVKKWLASAVKFVPTLDSKAQGRAENDLHLYSFALLAYTLGENLHEKLLDHQVKANERITWSAWREKLFDDLARTQNADGSWENECGKVHATALRLAILQLDYGMMAILQR